MILRTQSTEGDGGREIEVGEILLLAGLLAARRRGARGNTGGASMESSASGIGGTRFTFPRVDVAETRGALVVVVALASGCLGR